MIPSPLLLAMLLWFLKLLPSSGYCWSDYATDCGGCAVADAGPASICALAAAICLGHCPSLHHLAICGVCVPPASLPSEIRI